ncbi:GntR family transcriptional regulator [Spirochaetia bacterium]|nr:GntR family transcriptional regulator [Spirochaetia bacterium]
MIINGELKPGQKLYQDDLAARLGISRTPLVSAFSKLEQENLVITQPRRGAYVKQYTDKELLDICNIRASLESLGVREAAAVSKPEDWALLETHLVDFDRAVENNDEYGYKQADYNFHMEILRCSGNKFLYDMLHSFIIIVINMNDFVIDKELSRVEYYKILDAIKNRNSELAELLMDRHTERPCQLLKNKQ